MYFTDDSTLKNFYEKWYTELKVSLSDTLKPKLLFSVISPDNWRGEDSQDLDDEFHKNLQNEDNNRYLKEWYEKASHKIDSNIENKPYLYDIDCSIPESVSCYQKSQYDLIAIIEEK